MHDDFGENKEIHQSKFENVAFRKFLFSKPARKNVFSKIVRNVMFKITRALSQLTLVCNMTIEIFYVSKLHLLNCKA